MVVKGSQQETLNLCFVPLGTRQYGEPAILRDLALPDRLDHVSPSFIVTDVAKEVNDSIAAYTSLRRELMDHMH
ncbi:unnamed protein product [Schistosoma margrebowiei]|uniref:Uncharacterized protein n=1 Tax=Schistosoma margrebowiei TaxID=48269 RepID=A0A183LF96_9TREM|nr:unnamed protein product [Schistosoma margrebowiei]